MYRVIWQYAPSSIGDFASESVRSPLDIIDTMSSLFSDLPLLSSIEPVFPAPPNRLRTAALTRTPWVREDYSQDLAGYVHTFVPNIEAAELLIGRLTKDLKAGLVLGAEIQPQPKTAFRFSPGKRPVYRTALISGSPTPSDDLRPYQGYLLPATDGGIDAYFAWTEPGGRGTGIRIVDIENGWNFQHEDLRDRQCGVVYGPSYNDDHGTGALGIFSADRNGIGVEGIANDAVAMGAAAREHITYAPATGRPLERWNAAKAIYIISQRLRAGDVIVLEMHGAGPNANGYDSWGYVPLEYWKCERAAIRFATAKGIYVVEAGGNGGEDLDDQVYCGCFDRDNFDSEAIMVGGGVPPSQDRPRSRAVWSNYGSRFDLQAWGEEITTTGGSSANDLVKDPDPDRCYTKSYGGTSGAAAIIAGAVACVAGVRRAQGKSPLLPTEMRELLVRTGSLQVDSKLALAVNEHIGPQPDLRVALSVLYTLP